ncbi:cytosine permease [Streptomyces sp. NPDC050439]|uniref:purine-cytosine permease family protein n=1 Tax=unclassified Streptomyces TaxID=2593676 RepID=UPI0034383E02
MTITSESTTPTPESVPANEAPLTLDQPTPKVLSGLDQGTFWANLGVSLLGFSGMLVVLDPLGTGAPTLSFAAAVTASVVGTLIGTVALGLAAITGARTGAPSMVLLRGLFGAKASYLPTVLNVLQMVGWAVFELVVISTGLKILARQAFGEPGPGWLYVLIAGAVTTALTLRPLGALRIIRRYVTIAVVVAIAYLGWDLAGRGIPMEGGSWKDFWFAADSVIAVSISWLPLVADYSRHSRSEKAAFGGLVIGQTLAGVAGSVLGVAALAMIAFDSTDPYKVFDPFTATSVGVICFGVLVLREVDQSFANVYSTAVSAQNLLPRADRRILCLISGTLATTLALLVNMDSYASFLYLIGAVFIPMFAVLVVDFFVLGGHRTWDVSEQAPTRWVMLLPWTLGFATYQLIAPTNIAGWSDFWAWLQDAVGLTVQPWMSASLLSFAVAALATLAVGRRRRHVAASPESLPG